MEVIAIRDGKNKVLNIYGKGILIENQIPNIEPFNKLNVQNPCIKLENGKYIWGYQCWWGPTDKVKSKYKDYKFNIVPVENEVLPLKKEE